MSSGISKNVVSEESLTSYKFIIRFSSEVNLIKFFILVQFFSAYGSFIKTELSYTQIYEGYSRFDVKDELGQVFVICQ